MRVLVIVKASKDSEAGIMPSQEMFAQMGKFNEELANAGVMLAGEGLHPTFKGKRIKFSGEKRKITDGPFGKPKDLIAGYWLWKCESWEEAIEWAKRIPFQEGEVEIRQMKKPEFIPHISRWGAKKGNPRAERGVFSALAAVILLTNS
jgi:hypothetical protein